MPVSRVRNAVTTSVRRTKADKRPRVTILVCAIIGLLIGVALAALLSLLPSRYEATATLALTPEAGRGTTEDSALWEVLSRGQATRTTALVLSSPRFLPEGAAESGMSLTVGALPETTLIQAHLTASRPEVAEAVLDYVLKRAIPEASGVSGPFALKVVDPPEGSAKLISTGPVQQFLSLGLGGLLLGVGLSYGALRWAHPADEPTGPIDEPETDDSAEPEPDTDTRDRLEVAGSRTSRSGQPGA